MSLRWYFSLRAGMSLGLIGVAIFVGGGMQIYNTFANRPKFVNVSIEDLENGKLPNKEQQDVRLGEHVAFYPASGLNYAIVSVERAEKEVKAEFGEDGTLPMTPQQLRSLTQRSAVFVLSEKNHGPEDFSDVATKRPYLQGQIYQTITQNMHDRLSLIFVRSDFRGCVVIHEAERRSSSLLNVVLGVGLLILSFAVLGAAAYVLGNLDAD